jgi:hypothetical protein
LLGGVIGIVSTYLASRNARTIAVDQIQTQKEIAAQQLRTQGDATDKQLRAAVLAGNRIRWIEQVRTHIAAFAAGAMAVVTDLAANVDKSVFNPKIDKLNEHVAMVSLLLNYAEQDTQDLDAALRATTSIFNDIGNVKFDQGQSDRVEASVRGVEVIARKILKKEWNRVKNLE